jgi:hypothetical protein
MKDTKALTQNPPAPETPDADAELTQNPPAPETPDADAADEPPSFAARQATLNETLAQLSADYAALVSDIKANGKYFEGFRKIKETFFRLQALSARNGNVAPKAARSAAPPTDLFVRTERTESEAPAKRASNAPPTDLFVKGPRSVETVGPAITNPAPPPLFTRAAPPPKPMVERKAKPLVPPDAKRKVLADSEEKED